MRHGKIHEHLTILGASRVHDARDFQARASPQIIQFNVPARSQAELSSHVAADKAHRRVVARHSRIAVELPRWLKLARFIEPRSSDHDGGIVRARHDINVRRVRDCILRAQTLNLWKDCRLAH